MMFPKPTKNPKIKTKKPKKVTVRQARKKVETLFSIYIRTRDCLRTTGTKTKGHCVTCKRQYDFKELQAGHFVSGRHPTVIFNEKNCHAQCVGCNVFKRGNIIPYYQFMEKTYGKKVIVSLMKQDSTLKKFTVIELQELFNTFTIKLYELKG